MNAKPIVKWAGGKRQLIDKLLEHMPKEYNDFYVCVAQGNLVSVDFVNKKVFVKEGLIKVEYDGEEYFLCDEKNILAVVEE